jgi:hypothetical protein
MFPDFTVCRYNQVCLFEVETKFIRRGSSLTCRIFFGVHLFLFRISLACRTGPFDLPERLRIPAVWPAAGSNAKRAYFTKKCQDVHGDSIIVSRFGV